MYLKNETYREDLENGWRGTIHRERLCHKRILITGATGLIGSFMTDLLLYANKTKEAGIGIYILARDRKRAEERFVSNMGEENLHCIFQDVTAPLEVSASMDYIIHAAGDGFPSAFREHPVETMTPALFGTYQLLQYARKAKVKKFLYVSSGEVYGKIDKAGQGFEECDCGYLDSMEVRSCYPMAKRCGETLCASFGKEYRIPIIVARPGHTYGPCTSIHDNRATVQFLNSAAAGETVTLNSAGKQMRSYTYVSDCVSAILTILLNGKDGEAYNVANVRSRVTIGEFAEILARKAGTGYARKEPDKREKEEYTPIEYAVLDASKLERLGWQGQYEIDKGIEHMLSIRKQV